MYKTIKEIDRIRGKVNENRGSKEVDYTISNNEQIMNSALDVIKETSVDLNDIESHPKKRLVLVGALQSLYTQQDALFELYKIFKTCSQKKIHKFLKNQNCNDLMSIRTIRNQTTAGHPSNSYGNINYMGYPNGFTGDDFCFTYFLNKYNQNSGNTKKSYTKNLRDLIDKQDVELSKMLSKISDGDISKHY